MTTLLMPRQSEGKRSIRDVYLSDELGQALVNHALELDIPVASIIRRAFERYLKTPHTIEHRLFITDRDMRKSASVPDDLWSRMKARKSETNLDTNEMAQVAISLYLQADTQSQSQSQSQGADLELTAPAEKPQKTKKPLDVEEEARIRRMIDEAFEEKKSTFFEDLEKHGFKPRKPRIPALQLMKKVPRNMVVSAGQGFTLDELDNIVEMIGDTSEVEVWGRLAEKATPHSGVATVIGWSMSQDGDRMSIQNGADILLTPLNEFPRQPRTGDIVLAEIEFKDGRVVQTLKAYEKKRLRANNPDYPGFVLGPTMKQARIVAVCRGVLEKVFD